MSNLKKHGLYCFLVISMAILFSSCRSSKTSINTIESKQYHIDANHGSFLTRPIVADLEVISELKSIEYTGAKNLDMNDLKNNALAIFLKTHNCDYVADPIFETAKKSRNKKKKEISITLRGYPVKYTKMYQVDTLPASIVQYAEIDKDIRRLEYTRQLEVKEVVWGLEMMYGDYIRVQFDIPLSKSLRYYGSFERMGLPWSFKADIFENRAQDPYTGSGEGSNYFSFSTGLFKESILTDYMKLRYGGGLNFTNYDLNSDFKANNQFSFSKIYNLGLRLSVGFDFPIYRNFSLIGMAHYNLDGINIVVADDPGIVPDASLSVKKIDITKTPNPSLYLGGGIRVVF